jgi:cell wall-associated NlpC family hydrolase
VARLPSVRVRWILVLGTVFVLLFGGLVTVPLLMLMGSASDDTTSAGGDSIDGACGPVGTAGGQSVTLDADQLTNVRTIIATGDRLNVPSRGLVVAVAVALQESTVQNLDYGDRDSLGVFQQRAGWGSAADRENVAKAAAMFYLGGAGGQPGLLKIQGWASMSLTQAAQDVQRSAFPFAYAKWETFATSLVKQVVGGDPMGCSDVVQASLPSGTIGTFLRDALAQQGDPYVWGATGPDAFDCSGLVVYAWRLAGFRVTIRTAAQMWDNSVPVARGSEQPGDLLFGEWGPAGAGHVMIVIRPGLAVQAPSTGRDVQLTDYSSYGSSWKLGRLKASVLVPLSSSA